MFTRRKLLSLGVKAACGTSAALALRRFPLAHAAGKSQHTSLPPPRYFVKLYLPGGIDSVYTLDPKVKREVASGVDVPYRPDDIVSAAGLKLGPHFASLAKWAPRFTVLNGVDVSTANHNTGEMQALRLRTKTTGSMPSIFEVLGAHRDGQPLGAITLGAGKTECHTPGWFGQPGPLYGKAENRLLRHVDAASPEDLRVLAKVLRREAQSLTTRNQAGEVLSTGENIGDAAAFFERVADAPGFATEEWEGMVDTIDVPDMVTRLQRTLWLLENDLTSTAFVSMIGSSVTWDTHTDNARRQKGMNLKFAPMLDRFLRELDSRSNAHGRLSDQTVVMVASEIGRFPYMNTAGGKDHFPEVPFLFIGPWFRGGRSFGQTLKQMEAAPVDLATGKAASAGGHHVMVDDVGATLLALAGIDPELYGYNGKVLGFLLKG